MANKRDIKKQIKSETNRLIEDAYYQSLEADDKLVKKMDGFIDEIVEKRFDLLRGVGHYPKGEKRAKVKEHFNAIRTELDSHVAEYSKKIGRIG